MMCFEHKIIAGFKSDWRVGLERVRERGIRGWSENDFLVLSSRQYITAADVFKSAYTYFIE